MFRLYSKSALIAGYTAIAIALTYPLVLHPGTRVPHDLGDPILSTVILGWNAQHLPLSSTWWDGSFFHPAPGAMTFSDHRLGASLIASPLQWAGFSPLAAYNLTLIATFPLCALAAHWLGHTLTRRHDAAAIAGLAYGFNPYRIAHIEHLELLAAFGMPVALVGLHKYWGERRPKWLALFGAALLLQALSSTYYFLFFLVMLALWMAWFVRRGDLAAVAMSGVVCAAVGVAIAPIALTYTAMHARYGLARSPDEIAGFSADLTSIATASPLSALWGWTAPLNGPERQLFPGLVVVVIVAAALAVALAAGLPGVRDAWRRRSPFAWFVLAAVLLFAFSLGPTPTWRQKPVVRESPYRLLMAMPIFRRSVRVPARFAMPALLALSAAACIGFNRLAGGRRRNVVAALALAGIAADGWMAGLPLHEPPPALPPRVSTAGVSALLELPLGHVTPDAAAMYRSMLAGVPAVNGYSGNAPPHYPTLFMALEENDETTLDALAAGGALLVAIDHGWGNAGFWTEHLRRRPRSREVFSNAATTWFVLDRHQGPAPACQGARLPIAGVRGQFDNVDAAALQDGNPRTAWESAAGQRTGDRLTIDLGRIVRPCAVRMSIGPRAPEFPRALSVATSADGETWLTSYRGKQGGAAVMAAIAQPMNPVLDFALPDAPARFIRLQLEADQPRVTWVVAELSVTGAP